MWKQDLTLLVIILVLALPNVLVATISEDFEDGDYTNNPTWDVFVDVGEGVVAADPIRPSNLVWKAYGTETAHRILKTNVSGIPWHTFDVSLEYKASVSGNFHGTWKLESDGGTNGMDFGLWYDTEKSPAYSSYANLWVEDYGHNWQGEGTYTLIPIGDVPRSEWLKMHAWYDVDAGLVMVEVRILETNTLLGQVSRQPSFNLSQAGDIDGLGIGIEETNWQYMDNIVLTPEPMTLSLLVLGGLTIFRRRRK